MRLSRLLDRGDADMVASTALAETSGTTSPTDEFISSFGPRAFELIHEIELRGSCDWPVLAALADCLNQAGARAIAVTARRFDVGAEVINCRMKLEEMSRLDAIVAKLRKLSGVTAVLVTHHLTRPRAAG